jgi:Ca2+-transporting ATPase
MTAPVLDRAQWIRIIFLGGLIAVTTLVILDHFESRIGTAAADTMALTVFGLCEVTMGLSARSETGTVFDRDVMSGKQQLRLYGLSLLMIVLASELGVFQRLLDTTPLSGDQWLLCIGLALALLLIDEIIKVILRSRAGRSAEVPAASGRVAVAAS